MYSFWVAACLSCFGLFWALPRFFVACLFLVDARLLLGELHVDAFLCWLMSSSVNALAQMVNTVVFWGSVQPCTVLHFSFHIFCNIRTVPQSIDRQT